jgi:hypothetical protein
MAGAEEAARVPVEGGQGRLLPRQPPANPRGLSPAIENGVNLNNVAINAVENGKRESPRTHPMITKFGSVNAGKLTK